VFPGQLFVQACRYLELTIFYHASVIGTSGTPFALRSLWPNGDAENGMKIYLLMLLIGTLLTAIRFTSVPEQRSKTLQR
jgi:hypothetical protein